MKKIIVSFLVVIMLLAISVFALANGMAFSAETVYQTEASLTGFPVTFEATVSLPENYIERGGVVIGNYSGASIPCLSFEVYSNGQPRIYYIDDSKATGDYKFDSVNICKGVPVHVAVVMDRANSKAYCYVNGELKQTKDSTPYPSSITLPKIAVGGDLRGGNGQYFKGKIYDIKLYADMRTANEIKADCEGKSLDKDNLISAYDLTDIDTSTEIISDLSANGNDALLIKDTTWIEKEPRLEPYAYSFAVVGDTQIVNRDYPQKFSGIYDWILDNADRYNTKFIFGLGDITDDNTAREYALADAVFHRLKGVIPFSFVRGNHDKTAEFNEWFTVEKYGGQISGCYNNSLTNTYHKFDVGNVKYLAINIDCGAANNMLDWANKICEENPDRNVIVTTHGYIGPSGNVLAGSSQWPSRWGPNDPETIWNRFIKKHKNIKLVICGHSPSAKVVRSTRTGDNGNVVTQLLIDHQDVDEATDGGLGVVTMLCFSKDGKNVQVRTYSTIKEAYYMAENQFSFNMETVTSEEDTADAKIINASFPLNIPSLTETNTQITFDADKFTFTSDEKGKTSLNVDITSGLEKGKIIASVYDRHNRLRTTKIYPCAPIVTASFDEIYSGDIVRVHWWEGANSLMPIGNKK